MHRYRTHNCGELRDQHVGKQVKLSGWLHRKRDHGGVYFIDLRDHYGITQIVFASEFPDFAQLPSLSYETVITVEGNVVVRAAESINPHNPTGNIEVVAKSLEVHSLADTLPLNVNSDAPFSEEVRLRYRFLDLRREKMHQNIVLRNQVIRYLREKMYELGFMEFQTPILTSSSPEGARDFLVPSRLHPGKFYALPQAPQQFKQLLMMSGFDRYFQIAPCFRDEDARADRAPGEFYQLDIEMSFVTQDDVFNTIEPVLHDLFREFSQFAVTALPFPRIPYREAMVKYGTDKPDLRNPLIIADVSDVFASAGFAAFRDAIERGWVVRAIPAPGASAQPRSFFDRMVAYAQDELKAQGLGYISIGADGVAKGPIYKFLSQDQYNSIRNLVGVADNDAVFFVCQAPQIASALAGKIRTKLGEELGLIEQNSYRFCWITDFPLYEWNADKKSVDFSHNPFSMPQGGMAALEAADSVEKQLQLTAYQYDIVCNGIELCSGAIRNHLPNTMYRAFAIAGYSAVEVDQRFGSMIRAFHYGAPPHGGLAPGIDRIVMLLAGEPNIREVICFPLNQNGQDLLMDAPSEVSEKQLRELQINVKPTKIKQLIWTDVREIAIALRQQHPNIDPAQLLFTNLQEMALALRGFDPSRARCNEKILEAIQVAWLDEM